MCLERQIIVASRFMMVGITSNFSSSPANSNINNYKLCKPSWLTKKVIHKTQHLLAEILLSNMQENNRHGPRDVHISRYHPPSRISQNVTKSTQYFRWCVRKINIHKRQILEIYHFRVGWDRRHALSWSFYKSTGSKSNACSISISHSKHFLKGSIEFLQISKPNNYFVLNLNNFNLKLKSNSERLARSDNYPIPHNITRVLMDWQESNRSYFQIHFWRGHPLTNSTGF